MKDSRVKRYLPITPKDEQLKKWGITFDQYSSLYSKAEKDLKKSNSGLGRWLVSIADVNKYLAEQMVKTDGQYAAGAIPGIKKQTPSPVETPVALPSEAGGGGSSGGSGSGSSRGVQEYVPKYYTADDLAKRFGIINDYATILKELQDATAMKFDETETTMKRAEASNLRGQETAYNQYLQDLRSRAANAVASGATKGTMAANSLSSMLGLQEANREPVNTMNELLYDTAQQRGSALSADVVTARNQANEIGKYLGQLSTSMDTNEINMRAAQLAAEAQRYSAGVGASATTNAARIQANSQYDQLINAFTNDYINKGYNQNAAKSMAYTSYADLIRKQYAK